MRLDVSGNALCSQAFYNWISSIEFKSLTEIQRNCNIIGVHRNLRVSKLPTLRKCLDAHACSPAPIHVWGSESLHFMTVSLTQILNLIIQSLGKAGPYSLNCPLGFPTSRWCKHPAKRLDTYASNDGGLTHFPFPSAADTHQENRHSLSQVSQGRREVDGGAANSVIFAYLVKFSATVNCSHSEQEKPLSEVEPFVLSSSWSLVTPEGIESTLHCWDISYWESLEDGKCNSHWQFGTSIAAWSFFCPPQGASQNPFDWV